MKRTDLRSLARGQECKIRLPGVCTHDTETTVLAHVRLIGVSGMGLKAPDLLASHACARCHAAVDGQAKSEYSASERRLMLLEGMARTQAWLCERGFIRW